MITVISVLGVAAGVMALVIALAVNNGFRNIAAAQSAGRDGARDWCWRRSPRSGIENWRDADARSCGSSRTCERRADALRRGRAVRAHRSRPAAILKGIDLGHRLTLLRASQRRAFATSTSAGACPARSRTQLAQRSADAGRSWSGVISPQGETDAVRTASGTIQTSRSSALFEIRLLRPRQQLAFASLENAQQDVFSLGDVVNAIELKLDDLELAAETCAKLAEADAGPKLGATNWMEQNRQLLNALRMEKMRLDASPSGCIQMVARSIS